MIPVYIVDDVESDRYIARRRLTKSDRFGPVTEYESGADFLTAYLADQKGLPADPPPLVLMDINMPEMSGFETIEALSLRLCAGAEEFRPPEVAVFSSSDNERDLMRSRATGLVRHFFTKPLDPAAIEHILSGYAARGQIPADNG